MMRKRIRFSRAGIFTLALASLAEPQASPAAEVAGVTLEETVRAGDRTLNLNGAGVRRVLFVKIYVAGLYLEEETADARDIISQDGMRQVTLHMLRRLEGARIVKAIHDGFARNSPEMMLTLKSRLKEFAALIPPLKRDDRMSFRYAPGIGTAVALNGEPIGVIEGKDFADALFAVWLGRDPVQHDLKAALLGD